MQYQNQIGELKTLLAGKTIRDNFTKSAKRIYKLALCGIFGEILHGIRYQQSFYYGQIRTMLHAPELYQGKDFTKLEENFNNRLTIFYFYNFEHEEHINNVIAFFRNYIDQLEKKQKRLYKVDEVQKVYNVKHYFYDKGIDLKNHHLIDITFEHEMIHTVPEFFNYTDLIHLWNDFIEKRNKFKVLEEKLSNSQEHSEQQLQKIAEEARVLHREMTTYYRYLIIAGVTFVESFLYYYFYNIKHNSTISTKTSISRIMNFKGHIQDTQIVEDLIFKLHVNLANDTNIQKEYRNYKNAVEIRDRLIHTSVFINQSNQISELHPLINLQEEEVIDYLQNCINFVESLEKNLPQEEQLLFWWELFETPVFTNVSKVSPLHISRK